MRKSGLLGPIALVCSGFVAAATQGIATEQRQVNVPLTSADAAKGAPHAGNPLWAIPLGDLPETKARPLFSVSRRPPAPPVYALASVPAKPVPPRKPEPQHPLLTLVGTIVSRSVEIGVFIDDTSHDVIRLKAGDIHDGWTLSSVVDRAAFFQKDGYRAATLALPIPGTEAATNGRAATPVIQPVAGVSPANPSEPSLNPAAWRRPPKEG